MLYTLNSHSAVCQLHLSETGRKKPGVLMSNNKLVNK